MNKSPIMFRPINGPGLPRQTIEGSHIGVHQHIDNGGHTFVVDQYGNMIIETGFHGYSHTSVMLTAPDLDSLIYFLQQAKKFVAEHTEE
jgi:hypothetical protein